MSESALKTYPQPDAPPSARPIGSGRGWSITEYICRAGPRDRPFEEQHESVSIAAVLEGTFQYRATQGAALLYPGALLLGNAGACFECGHDHGIGDRCVAFQFDAPLFDEIAHAATGEPEYRFPASMLPPSDRIMLPLVEIETLARGSEQGGLEEAAIQVVEQVTAALGTTAVRLTARRDLDHRRISRTLRHIEENFDQPLDLDGLAEIAAMSKYHFLRTFRRVVGATPYTYLLGWRLRRAALLLRSSRAPISIIAYQVGFGDLSTFNERFRQVFGQTPSLFRRSG